MYNTLKALKRAEGNQGEYKMHTVECRYSAVHHNMVLQMVQQWLR